MLAVDFSVVSPPQATITSAMVEMANEVAFPLDERIFSSSEDLASLSNAVAQSCEESKNEHGITQCVNESQASFLT